MASKAHASKRHASRRSSERTQVRSLWSGTLSFGLVSVPVELVSATHDEPLGLRMLSPSGTPLARRFFCPEDGEAVPPEHLVRGYELRPGKYVVVTDEELEALEPEKSRDIDLRLFVPADSIDPIYFDRGYYLLPGGDSSKAYALLATVMENEQRAGIATFVMREREYLVAIFARSGLLCAEALRFAADVRAVERLGLGKAAPPKASARTAFERLIRKGMREFDQSMLQSDQHSALRKLAENKAERDRDVVELAEPAETDLPESVDLMAMLTQSLNKAGAGALKHTLRSRAAPEEAAAPRRKRAARKQRA